MLLVVRLKWFIRLRGIGQEEHEPVVRQRIKNFIRSAEAKSLKLLQGACHFNAR